MLGNKTPFESALQSSRNNKVKTERDNLLIALKECREWYDKHGKDYEIGLPNCFVKAKKVISEIDTTWQSKR